MIGITRNWVAMTLLLSTLAGAATAQRVDPFRLHLPKNRTLEAAQAWAGAQLPKAMRTMLNSDGDALTLHIEGGFSAGLFVNGGAKIEFDTHLARGDEGGTYYEVAIGADVAATAGVELAEGIEGNAALGVGGTTVYRYATLADACRGVEALIIATANDSIVGAPFINKRKAALRAAQKTLGWAKKGLRTLKRATPKFLRKRGWFKRKIRRWSRRISNANKTISRLQSYLKQYNRFKSDVRTARARLRAARYCREVRLSIAGSLEASLGVPGLSLEGLGAGVSGEVKGTAAVRIFPKRSATQDLEIVRSVESTVELWAAAVIGGELTQQHGITFADSIRLQNGRYARTLASTMTLTTDTGVRGSLGVGIAGKYGVGRSMAFTVQTRDAAAVSQALVRAFLNVRSAGDFNDMIAIAGSLPVEFALQDRYDAGLKMKIGVSGAGNGFNVGGSTFWIDAGVNAVEVMTIAEALGRLQQATLVRQIDAAAKRIATSLS